MCIEKILIYSSTGVITIDYPTEYRELSGMLSIEQDCISYRFSMDRIDGYSVIREKK